MPKAIAAKYTPNSKRIMQILLQCLFLVGVSRLVHAQEDTNSNFDVNDIFENNNTLTPTLVDPASSSPSAAPTASGSPTDIGSDSPSFDPSQSPTNFPTATVSPSESPTASYQPSHSPSVSPRPSSSMLPSSIPSESPTKAPSRDPTSSPSGNPTISSEPTISPAPTLSFAPSLSRHPSDTPSAFPSDSPSSLPTVSSIPSSLPSDAPSQTPSISMQPSMVPSVSHAPSASMRPSTRPSEAPSPYPTGSPTASTPFPSFSRSNSSSLPLTVIPTITQSPMPTPAVSQVIQNNIFMYLTGMPGELKTNQRELWIGVTENHIWRFFDEFNKRAPGVIPVNVSRVHGTLIRDQNFTVDSGTLAIEYLQAIDYFLFESDDVNEEALRKQMFLLPFENDAQSYILDLITVLGLEQWVEINNVNVGPSSSPTSTPTVGTQPPTEGLSRGGLRGLSASIVLSSILVVAYLFWDRHRKEKLYLQTHANDFETMEYDNAGQAGDWRNPYSPTATRDGSPVSQGSSIAPQDREVNSAPILRNLSPQTTASTVVAATPPGSGGGRQSRTSNSLPSIPAKDGSHQSSSGGIGSHALMTTPPSALDHARHVSVADTDITDLTYSDGGGGGRSDAGSDCVGGASNIPMLPTVSDERYNGYTQWSPLEIPEEEPYSASGSQDEDDLSNGLGDNLNNPSMSGFQMKIQELE